MKKRIGLIFGGQSEERLVSIKSAAAIRKYIDKTKYHLIDIEITPKIDSVTNLIKKVGNINLALLVLHGPGGEDGKIQGILDLLGVKYTSSGVLSSAIAMNKAICKQIAKGHGLNIAKGELVTKNSKPKYSYKCVVKPNSIGSSLGISIVENRASFAKAIRTALKYDPEVLVEQYISGKEYTVPVLSGKALPVIEIIPNKAKFFDYKSKYEVGGSEEVVPARLDNQKTKQVQRLAELVHNALGCRGLTRSDFILSGNKFYFLELNTIPGMTEQSLAPKSAKAAGISFTKLIDRIIES